MTIAPDYSRETREMIAGRGAAVLDVPLRRTGLSPLFDLGTCLRIARILQTRRVDTVFCYNIKAALLGSLSAWVVGVRYIYTNVTGVGYMYSDSSPKARLLRAIIRLPHMLALRTNRGIFFQNRDDLNLYKRFWLLGNGVESFVINGSGVDLGQYAYCGSLPNRPVFLFCGRLLRDKGLIEYASAAEDLKRRYPLASFRIAGRFDDNPNGILSDELERWVRQGAVEYLGELKSTYTALTQCTAFVLPSYREGTPRAVLEAMAVGRAIVTTNAPGCRETVLEGYNGFLVPPRDARALSQALERIILDSALAAKFGRNSRKLAEEKFDVNAVNREILRHVGLVATESRQCCAADTPSSPSGLENHA